MNNLSKKLSLVVASAAVLSTNAMAALPEEATTAMTALGADALAMIGLVWTYGSPIVIGFVVWKMFKRGSSKI